MRRFSSGLYVETLRRPHLNHAKVRTAPGWNRMKSGGNMALIHASGAASRSALSRCKTAIDSKTTRHNQVIDGGLFVLILRRRACLSSCLTQSLLPM
jgi:hypothetical protein